MGCSLVLQDKTAALRYIASSVGQSQAVKYLEDGSLPSGWRCQRIQTSIYFFSPRGERLVIGWGWVVGDHVVCVSGLRPGMQSLTGWRRRGLAWRWWPELGEEARSKSTI